MLYRPESYQPEEWSLMASLLAEAEIGLRDQRPADSTYLETVIDDFREAAVEWEKPRLARQSRAARRRFRALLEASGL